MKSETIQIIRAAIQMDDSMDETQKAAKLKALITQERDVPVRIKVSKACKILGHGLSTFYRRRKVSANYAAITLIEDRGPGMRRPMVYCYLHEIEKLRDAGRAA